MKAILPTVLIVDSDPRSREAAMAALAGEFDVQTASDGHGAERIAEREFVQVILCDHSSIGFLKLAHQRWPETVRILVTGEPDALEPAVGSGVVWQCLERPWKINNLKAAVRNAARFFALHRENEQLGLEIRTLRPSLKKRCPERSPGGENAYLERIVHAAHSPIEGACEMVRRVAPYDIAVLLTGESGTGKELLARALHHHSPRAGRPFVAENCGALTDQLLESELFGHCKGSFTGAIADYVGLFEQADGGTIFLDEIGETSPTFQVKLLRVLQEGEVRPVGGQRRKVDVRLVTATNRELEAEVRAGRFRQDLYFRLATVTIDLPPVRHRPMDIPLLAQSLLAEAIGHFNKCVRGFTREALECMQRYYWSGNVREMRNEIQRMLILADGELLGADLLSPKVRLAATPDEEGEFDMLTGIEGTLRQRIESLEARILRETLMRHRWNKSRAALELGLSRVGLRGKLVRYGLERGDGPDEVPSDRNVEAEELH